MLQIFQSKIGNKLKYSQKKQEENFEKFKKFSTEDKISMLKSYIDTKKSQNVDTSAEYYEILFS